MSELLQGLPTFSVAHLVAARRLQLPMQLPAAGMLHLHLQLHLAGWSACLRGLQRCRQPEQLLLLAALVVSLAQSRQQHQQARLLLSVQPQAVEQALAELAHLVSGKGSGWGEGVREVAMRALLQRQEALALALQHQVRLPLQQQRWTSACRERSRCSVTATARRRCRSRRAASSSTSRSALARRR